MDLRISTEMWGIVTFSRMGKGACTEIDHCKDLCLVNGLAIHKINIRNFVFKCRFLICHTNASLEDLPFIQRHKMCTWPV